MVLSEQFSWPVAEAGYQFGEFHSSISHLPERFLVKVSARKQVERRYFPFAETKGLFLEFISAPLSEEGICAFADKYGLLDRGEFLSDAEDPDRSLGISGEALATWTFAISEMNQAARIWDHIKQQDSESLKKLFSWKSDNEAGTIVEYAPPQSLVVVPRTVDPFRNRRFRTIAKGNSDIDWFQSVQDKDYLAAGKRYLLLVLNAWVKNAGSFGIGPAKNTASLQMQIVPHSLLGALWLQFAQAVEQNKDYRRCAQCDRWLEISLSAVRKSKLFCSNACRTKAFRQRQAEAARLAAEGKSHAEIAEELESETETGKGSIESKKTN